MASLMSASASAWPGSARTTLCSISCSARRSCARSPDASNTRMRSGTASADQSSKLVQSNAPAPPPALDDAGAAAVPGRPVAVTLSAAAPTAACRPVEPTVVAAAAIPLPFAPFIASVMVQRCGAVRLFAGGLFTALRDPPLSVGQTTAIKVSGAPSERGVAGTERREPSACAWPAGWLCAASCSRLRQRLTSSPAAELSSHNASSTHSTLDCRVVCNDSLTHATIMSASSAAASSSGAAPETADAYLALALRLAHQAGAALLECWLLHPNDRPRFGTKSSSADVVTETDQRCERIIFSGIQSVYPRHRLLGEESHETEGQYELLPEGSQEAMWIVDPIDGTNNFVHQLPNVAVSIAVLRGRQVVAAVVHRPTVGESAYATLGGGAWKIAVPTGAAAASSAPQLNTAQRLRVSNVTSLSGACVATEMGYSRSEALVDLMLSKVRALLTQGQTQSLRMSGSCCCNMVDVAASRLDAYYEGSSTSVGPKPWDVAAGSLIVAEAGGAVSDVSGAPFSLWNGRVLVAANNHILLQVAQALNLATTQWNTRHPHLADTVAYKPLAGIAAPKTSSTTNTSGNSSGNSGSGSGSGAGTGPTEGATLAKL